MIKIISPKDFLNQEEFDSIKTVLAKIEDIMCDFALKPETGKNGMIALAMSITHLALAPMIELDRDMVEVFFDGMLAQDMPEIHDTEQCVKVSMSPESLN